MRYRYRIAGFTLLELMLSVALGLMLLLGAFTLFVAAMKNSEAVMIAQQKQTVILSVMQTLVNDIEQADAFGCSRACAQSLHWQGLRGDASQMTLTYQGQPQLRLLQVSDDGFRLSLEPTHRFNKNNVLLIAQPDEAATALVLAEGKGRTHHQLTLTQALLLHHPIGASVGPFISHHYIYDAHQKSLKMQDEQGAFFTLLADVDALSFYYDIKTPSGIITAQPSTAEAWANVCGVDVVLSVSHQTWVRYVPVLSHCL